MKTRVRRRHYFIGPIVLFLIACISMPLSGEEFQRLFIGTYTGGENGSQGIYTCRFDPERGEFHDPTLAAPCDNPSFLAIHPVKPRLYAVGSQGKTGMLYAFDYDGKTGRLTERDKKEIPGRGPCHLALCLSESGDRQAVVVANYSSGTVVSFPILDDGKIGDAASDILHAGSGPNVSRQKEPHPHGAYFDRRDRRTVAVPDLGIDKVVFYEIDLATARLTPAQALTFLEVSPGGGPRHMAVSEDGRYVYVNNELTSTVSVFDLKGDRPSRSIQEITTLPEGADPAALKNSTAEIELSRSGRFLYVSNRGHDSIAVYVVDPENGRLSLIQNAPCGGTRPRFFALEPTERFLISCNKGNGTVTLLSVDASTGKLAAKPGEMKISRPVCIVFAP